MYILQHFTYNKEEKLKSRKAIEHLFTKGKSMSAFPIKMIYDLVDSSDTPLKAGVTVSSRTFKKAVQRNRVKRVLREAFRLQKTTLQTALKERQQYLTIFFIFTGKELPVYVEVYEKMGILLNKLAANIIKDKQID
ncbi:MAG TPA: ribonuclease P protein component [Segetibacter sp.]